MLRIFQVPSEQVCASNAFDSFIATVVSMSAALRKALLLMAGLCLNEGGQLLAKHAQCKDSTESSR